MEVGNVDVSVRSLSLTKWGLVVLFVSGGRSGLVHMNLECV